MKSCEMWNKSKIILGCAEEKSERVVSFFVYLILNRIVPGNIYCCYMYTIHIVITKLCKFVADIYKISYFKVIVLRKFKLIVFFFFFFFFFLFHWNKQS